MVSKIFIATSSFAHFSKEPIEILNEHGYEISINDYGRKLNKKETIAKNLDSVGIIAGTETYSKDVLEKLNSLKVISRLGVGMDNVDLKFTTGKNINVFRTETTPAPAVAELALGLIIDLNRNITQNNNLLKEGKWHKQMGYLVSGKTIGIIGLGTIGKTFIKLVKNFDLNILAFDLSPDNKFASDYGVNYCDIDTLLQTSDIVTIHLNLTRETNKFLGSEKIKLMKPDSILINTSRGEVIDEDALYDALQNNKIRGAGLDVYNDEPYFGSLTKLDNVVLTSHIGAYAKEIRIKMEIEAAKNLIRGLNEL